MCGVNVALDDVEDRNIAVVALLAVPQCGNHDVLGLHALACAAAEEREGNDGTDGTNLQEPAHDVEDGGFPHGAGHVGIVTNQWRVA